jgi:hypothetical protein
MIIGNLAGALPFGGADKAAKPAQGAGDGGRANADDAAARKAHIADPVPSSSVTDGGSPLSMRQTARIMSMIAVMSNVDEVSAYSLVGGGDGKTDEFRQVVSAYRDNSF